MYKSILRCCCLQFFLHLVKSKLPYRTEVWGWYLCTWILERLMKAFMGFIKHVNSWYTKEEEFFRQEMCRTSKLSFVINCQWHYCDNLRSESCTAGERRLRGQQHPFSKGSISREDQKMCKESHSWIWSRKYPLFPRHINVSMDIVSEMINEHSSVVY